MSNLNDRVAAVIRDEMERRKWSLNRLADTSNVSRPTLTRGLRGANLTVPHLDGIANALGIPAHELVRRAEEGERS